jgi:predicted Zn-dependent protease
MAVSRNDARRRWVVAISFVSMVPSAVVVTLACLRWSRVSASPAAILGAAALFGALSISVGRIALRAFIRRTQAEAPRRAYVTALPIAGIVFIPLVRNVLANVFVDEGKSLPADLAMVAFALAGVLALAYEYPILVAARALATDALDVVETALFGAAVSLSAMSLFLRFTCEAQHFHDDARRIGASFGVAAIAFGVAALVASILRWRWVRAAFRKDHRDRGVVPFDDSLHAGVPPLDVDGRGEGDGIMVRFTGDRAKAPYRDVAHSLPLARTWLDARRALAPLVRRIGLSAVVVVAALAGGRVASGDAPKIAHLEREDRSATMPSGRVGFPASCTRPDPIILVPFGIVRGADVNVLSSDYALAYDRPIYVAPTRPLPARAFNEERHQWSAEAILDDLTPPPDAPPAIYIAITSADLYIEHANWSFAFGLRRAPNLAVVSDARMRDVLPGQDQAAVTEYRLRKMITRDLGILYCQMAPNDNPRSVLSKDNMSIRDLDRMDESIW